MSRAYKTRGKGTAQKHNTLVDEVVLHESMG